MVVTVPRTMAEQGRRWRAWRQPGAWSLTGYPAPGRVTPGPTGTVRVVIVDDSAEVRTLVRTQAPAVRRRGRGGRGCRRRRRGRPRPSPPARRDAAGRLHARDGWPGGPAPGAGRVAGHPRRHVQRVRRGAARDAGPRPRRHVVPHQDLVARGRRRASWSGVVADDGVDRPAGRPRPGRRRARRGAARGPGRAVPERVRRRRDRHGHDDPAGPDRAGQHRAVPHPRPAERGAPRERLRRGGRGRSWRWRTRRRPSWTRAPTW